MPQLHLYVSESEAAALRRKAKSRRMSLSKYLAEVVRRDVHPGWPDRYFEDVVGGWKGAALKRPEQGEHEEREGL